MKIAIGSDMKTHLTDVVLTELEQRGHQIVTFGALKQPDAPWPAVGLDVGKEVSLGNYDQGILFCWTGTGISIAANKVKGIRAALCIDAETASGARKWNDANILVMSLRKVSEEVAKEILNAWFTSEPSKDQTDLACLKILEDHEK